MASIELWLSFGLLEEPLRLCVPLQPVPYGVPTDRSTATGQGLAAEGLPAHCLLESRSHILSQCLGESSEKKRGNV